MVTENIKKQKGEFKGNFESNFRHAEFEVPCDLAQVPVNVES